eukprot:g31198.t1
MVLALQGLTAELDGTARCTQTLLLLVRAFNYVSDESTWASVDGFGELIHVRREQCGKVRREEVKKLQLEPDRQRLFPHCAGVLEYLYSSSTWSLVRQRARRRFERGEEIAVSGGAFGSPDVATRDFGKPQTLNNGVVMIRSSPRGHFFLDLLLEKAAWMQNIEKDQGAFDETVLEILGLEATARGDEGAQVSESLLMSTAELPNNGVSLEALLHDLKPTAGQNYNGCWLCPLNPISGSECRTRQRLGAA